MFRQTNWPIAVHKVDQQDTIDTEWMATVAGCPQFPKDGISLRQPRFPAYKNV